MAARTEGRKQFLHDVFVTALEGGIGYWSECSEYHWDNGGGLDDLDLDGFYAVITDSEDEDKEYRITLDTIVRGVNRIAKAKGPYYDPNGAGTQCADVEYLTKGVHDTVMAATFENDASDLDAGLADEIVQVGLFGKVVYG